MTLESVRLERLVEVGVSVPLRGGGLGMVKMEKVGWPFRADGGPPKGSKGWWGVRVRSEFGAESVLRLDPVSGKVDGLLRVVERGRRP